MNRRHGVLLFCAALFLWNLGGHDLWAPDEPYFAEGAREMIVDGRWAVPHVNGKVTTDKPPLFFWAIALLSLPFGEVTAWTARLTSAFAALGTVLLTMRFGRRLGGPRVAWLAAVALATAVMFWDKARWTQIDSLLCLLIWCALSAFESWRAGDADGRRAGIAFGLATALAVLAKGPVGLLLPLGIVIVTLAFDRQLGRLREFAPLAGPLAFATVVGLWVVLATVGGGGEYSVWGALREHFIDRGLHGMHHRQPPWYYATRLPAHLMPWTGLVPGALLLAWRQQRPNDRLLLIICGFIVLFFSISTEKRGLYVLPAIPAFALLVASFIDRVAAAASTGSRSPVGPAWLLRGQMATAAVLGLVGLVLPFAALERDVIPLWTVLPIAVTLGVAAVATVGFARRRRILATALAPAAGMAVLYLWAVSFAYPALDPVKSARIFSERLRATTDSSRAAGHAVLAFNLTNLPEAVSFYGDGLYTVETEDLDELQTHLSQVDPVWAIANGAAIGPLVDELAGRIVVADRVRLARREVLVLTNDLSVAPVDEP